MSSKRWTVRIETAEMAASVVWDGRAVCVSRFMYLKASSQASLKTACEIFGALARCMNAARTAVEGHFGGGGHDFVLVVEIVCVAVTFIVIIRRGVGIDDQTHGAMPGDVRVLLELGLHLRLEIVGHIDRRLGLAADVELFLQLVERLEETVTGRKIW